MDKTSVWYHFFVILWEDFTSMFHTRHYVDDDSYGGIELYRRSEIEDRPMKIFGTLEYDLENGTNTSGSFDTTWTSSDSFNSF